MINKKFLAYAVSAVMLGTLGSSCSSVNQAGDVQVAPATLLRIDAQGHDRIAHNFVHTLTQLDALSPIPTTIQMMAPSTPFGWSLEHHVIESGYGHQLVDGDMGMYFLRYRVESAETQRGYTQVFEVSIGDIVLEREFQVIDSHLTPVSPMRIGGAETESLELNDDIFRFNNPNEFKSAIVSMADSVPATAQTRDKARLPLPVLASATETTRTDTSINANVYETGVSNHEAIFRDYKDVRKAVLGFANDSYKLSFRNWDVMEEMLEVFVPETDIFSILGCSLGRTSEGQDNAGLAISRTGRVKGALVRDGVDPGKIYDESCWGRGYRDGVFPRRGVVLTIKRRRE